MFSRCKSLEFVFPWRAPPVFLSNARAGCLPCPGLAWLASRSLASQAVMSKFGLREGKDEQTYGLGLKEVWRVPKEKCTPG